MRKVAQDVGDGKTRAAESFRIVLANPQDDANEAGDFRLLLVGIWHQPEASPAGMTLEKQAVGGAEFRIEFDGLPQQLLRLFKALL